VAIWIGPEVHPSSCAGEPAKEEFDPEIITGSTNWNADVMPVDSMAMVFTPQVFLVDPRQSRHAPGRPKSVVLDCQWLRRLHSYGLLTASFRPADQVVVLRSYLRQRQMLIRYAGGVFTTRPSPSRTNPGGIRFRSSPRRAFSS
jgi:hypothetical protein